jgi:hypothetical protein
MPEGFEAILSQASLKMKSRQAGILPVNFSRFQQN